MEVSEYFFDSCSATILFGILIPFVVYRYLTRNYDYWQKRGIPYVKPYPLIGNFGDFFLKSFSDIEIDRYKKYGRIYGLFERNKPILTVGEPELIKDILVKDFQYFGTRRGYFTGDPIFEKMLSVVTVEDWKRIRTIVSPAFSTGNIKRVMGIFKDGSKRLMKRIKMISEGGNSVDVLKLYNAFAYDIVATSAFSIKFNSQNNLLNELGKVMDNLLERIFSLSAVFIMIIPDVFQKIRPLVIPKKAMEFYRNIILEAIVERKKSGEARNDFLQLLIDSSDELEEKIMETMRGNIESNHLNGDTNHQSFKRPSTKCLSMNEVLAQCLNVFIASHHTTQTVLSATTYLLAIHQDIQEKLYKEITRVLKENEGELTYDNLKEMKYLDKILKESLRLYTPDVRLERTADFNYKLGCTGITIPKGMIINIPITAIHRDPEFFPEPENFNPDRFSPEEKEIQVPYTYLPFGNGPRSCVGNRFALLNIKTCLINMFSTFHVTTCSETKVPLEFTKGDGFLTPTSVILHLEARLDCPLK